MRRTAVRIANNGLINHHTSLRVAPRYTTSFISKSQGSRGLSATAVRRDEERKWSTPLAKQLTEAINVCILDNYFVGYFTNVKLDNRSYTSC